LSAEFLFVGPQRLGRMWNKEGITNMIRCCTFYLLCPHSLNTQKNPFQSKQSKNTFTKKNLVHPNVKLVLIRQNFQKLDRMR
jgi:hypothetical protein